MLNLRPTDKSKFIKIKKPRRERSVTEKKMYFKTLEQNLIQAGDLIRKQRLDKLKKEQEELQDYQPKRPNEHIVDVKDPKLLKQVLVNCQYILQDTSTDQKKLEKVKS